MVTVDYVISPTSRVASVLNIYREKVASGELELILGKSIRTFGFLAPSCFKFKESVREIGKGLGAIYASVDDYVERELFLSLFDSTSGKVSFYCSKK